MSDIVIGALAGIVGAVGWIVYSTVRNARRNRQRWEAIARAMESYPPYEQLKAEARRSPGYRE